VLLQGTGAGSIAGQRREFQVSLAALAFSEFARMAPQHPRAVCPPGVGLLNVPGRC